MAGFKETFNNSHVVLPVIHVETERQTLLNAEIAKKEGADGVFLISMSGMGHERLSKLHETVRHELGTWWIGVNYLDLPAEEVFKNLNPGISGVWSDESTIHEEADEQIDAEIVKWKRKKSKWDGLYFGAVAFKYQPSVNDLERSAKIATQYMDVVTTSGTGTGTAPEWDKIARMKTAIQDFPLAIASGISPENVNNYLDVADCFLVATSLLVPGRDEFIPSKVRDLVQAVRS